jgi:hypothetical protein
MPQETNLNVSPYFDDFDPQKNYHKILFKPGYPVQARELTGFQSILQNQIEQFGNHIFKEGSVVIPGGIFYNTVDALILENTFNGVNIDFYIDNLLNKVIIGQNSGVKARVVYVLKQNEDTNTNTILYLSYLNTSSDGSETFNDAENILVEEIISPGFTEITPIQTNQAFATSINSNATSIGSLVILSDGVYFLRGYFINVPAQTIVLDPTNTFPSYKIGFTVLENIINSDIDESLVDNAKGFSNYAAPGADRFQINAILTKVPLNIPDEVNTNSFIELIRVERGSLTKNNANPQYNVLADELARRTYDESGDYYVRPFKIEVKNSLNDKKGNEGIYIENQLTYQNQVPSDSLGVYKVSPGKAYVKGYELQLLSSSLVDFEKPRTTKTLTNQSIIYSTGSTYSLNRVYGSPTIGISTYTISLRNDRLGDNQYSPVGKEIGVARVYDFALESGSYDSILPNTNQWEISLYDIQTYTEISLNEPIILSTPTFIKGKVTGATGFLRFAANNSGIITAYNTNGTFAKGERFIFDGIENTRIATDITSYNTGDIKSLYGITGTASTFTADTRQYDETSVGPVNITAKSSGISTVTSSNFTFVGVVTAGNFVSFSNPGLTTPVYAKVQSVSERSLTISGITTVTGICEGALPISNITPSDFAILKSRFLNSTDNTLYQPLSKKYISSVNLTNSQLIIRKQFNTTISSNSLTIPSTQLLSNEVFLPFDEERYVLIGNDGTTEPLSVDQFSFTSGGKELTINGLSGNGNARLIATLQKTNIKSRVKNKNRIKSIIIDKSIYNYSGTNTGTGNTTNNDGLIHGNYPYGTRVQDEDICLNVPEVTKIYSIFESSGIQDPTLPSLSLQNISSVSSTVSDIVIGEEIIGQSSGSVAICLEKPNSLTVSYTNINGISFNIGESIFFKESGVTAIINTFTLGSNDIKNNFILNPGQKGTILDYSKIIRKSNSSAPTKKIKIYYESAYIPTSDTGDITVIDSYNQFDYCDLATVDGYKVSDIIDTRPIVDQFNPESSQHSPFEFFGRSFDENQNSSLNILTSDEAIVCDYSFYLGRIDRIYLSTETNNSRISDTTTKKPIILVKQGTPAESPQIPDEVVNSLEVARILLPPYLCNTRDVGISLIDHKRYRMNDIAKLETRIKNLEFYSSLSLLENNAKNLQIKDSNNFDRFKSGIFVDNFTNTDFQRKTISVKNSIDITNGELRPSPFTTEVDMLLGSRSLVGIGTSLNPNADIKYVTDLIGNGIRRSGINPTSTGKGVVTLDYNLFAEIRQPFATRIENVTPYLVISYVGMLELNPSSDIWTDQVKLEVLSVDGIGGELTTTNLQFTENEFNQQSGWSPVIWNAWENNWTGSTTNTTIGNNQITTTTTTTGTASRIGTSNRILNTTSNISLGNRVVNIDVAPFVRSRNIEFNAKALKPFSRVYAFFDGQDVNQYIIPKLIEIEMLEGVFEVGETLEASVVNSTDIGALPSQSFRVRVSTANHRYGQYDDPVDIFIKNPYNQNEDLPNIYSSNSTILNIDTTSLSDLSSFDFTGYINLDTILIGSSSSARARVRDIRLISDRSGVVIGSFFIPNPNVSTNPSFRTGTKTLKLTNDRFNSPLPGSLSSVAETNYYADGLISQSQETILSVRNTEIQNAAVGAIRAITETDTVTAILPPPPSPPLPTSPPSLPTWNPAPAPAPRSTYGYDRPRNADGSIDPLAQSFFIGSDLDSVGRYVSSIELFFQSKDDTLPVTVQLRPMSLGTPTTEIYPFSTVTLYPDQINVSDDASVPTFINFQAPVYLEGNKEHCLVVLSHSTEYNVWISRLGEVDISTAAGAESAQVFVTAQTTLGSLFKSQNASTWTPSQYEDLKFNLYTARFDSEGSISFFSPELSENNNQIATLKKDSLQTTSRKIRVGLGTTVTDSNLNFGNLISQFGSNATGTFIGVGGSATGTLQIINSGIGYTPNTGSLTYNNVTLFPITGNGRDAKANITIQNGVAIAATVSIGGTGYSVGDIITASQIGITSLGRNLRFSVVGIGGTNELILNNIQGDFSVGIGNTLYYSSSTGVGATPINGGGVYITSPPIIESDGVHIKINHLNHGMHSATNTVKIYNITPDIEPTTLMSEYQSTSTASIPISSGFTTSFETFEGVGVGTTNSGYILIGNEIISYEGIVNNNLVGITRGIDLTQQITHTSGSLVYKYELSGVSLRRINTTHQLQDAEVEERIGIDHYTVKINMGENGIDRTTNLGFPKLYLNSTKSTGGSSIKATQNIPFEIVRPIIQTVVHPRTRLTGELKTISGTSISGSELSFEDRGFTSISLEGNNYFSDPRIIASKVNELEKLNEIPGNKSMELRLNLSTSDNRLSPVIDLDRVGMICISNRVNNVITDFKTDSRISTLKNDPSSFIYAVNPIQLEIPATSIKIIIAAYINPYADLKSLYAILNDPSEEPIYYPFPGYSNRIESGQVIDISNNDGTSDLFVSKNNALGFDSNEITFRDYEFTVDNLESFRYFSIKLIGTSTNQCYPPRLRDLRIISLA